MFVVVCACAHLVFRRGVCLLGYLAERGLGSFRRHPVGVQGLNPNRLGGYARPSGSRHHIRGSLLYIAV